MPIQYLSGTPYPRVSDPVVSTVANDHGLYPWSVISAYLSTLVEGDIVSASGLETETVDLLIFGQDLPASASLLATDNTAVAQYQSDVLNTLGLSFLFTTSGGIVEVAADNYGQVLEGYAGALSAVRVSGFAAQVSVTAPGAEGVADTAKLVCITNGQGLIAPIGGPTLSATAPTPIILENGDYTNAIRSAGNLLTDGAGNLFMVVGLYAVVAP